MKEAEIRKGCAICGKGVMHNRMITIYRVKIDYLVVQLDAVRRQAGFEQMMGSPRLAQVMGDDRDMATVFGSVGGLVCMDCAMNGCIASSMESMVRHSEIEEQKQHEVQVSPP